MQNRWSEQRAAEFAARYGAEWGEDLALRSYASRLLGSESALVLHGGGNTSLKSFRTDVFGEQSEALLIKASGHDLAEIEPEQHVAVKLAQLRRLSALTELSDAAMLNELRTHLFDHRAPTPSIETLVHAFLPGRFVDHTHADAVLALTNQTEGERCVREALGDEVVLLPYAMAGFQLAKQVAEASEAHPEAHAMVWMHHGIVTWGDSARESYDLMIHLVSQAEAQLSRCAKRPLRPAEQTPIETAERRLARVAPVVRGLLARPTGDPDRPFQRVVLRPLLSREVLDFVDSKRGRELALSPPLTSDHLIRTKTMPLWLDRPDYADEEALRAQLEQALQRYAEEYRAYLNRHLSRSRSEAEAFDLRPRVLLLPGLGALCAGSDAQAARIARDITAQTLAAKARIAAMGSGYRGPEEAQLFEMEYRTLQLAKLRGGAAPPLGGQLVLVTGAAGAIGAGICARLLDAGAHVAATDLAGPQLESLVAELSGRFGDRVIGVPLDVTKPESVKSGFDALSRSWGGVDAMVVSAGVAHVSSLEEMDLEHFRRLQRVNTEGTLLLLGEAARQLGRQGTGGDIVLISTKNVFAPGAGFGAYSATKAAAHQLARIASLELAERDVRVNTVAPDAVFAHGERRSGLWAEVGPDRMKARGLDAEGLEAYYRSRNLLKARISADHVANAVLFFLSRQTPTTGATLPVDGGLPDATPR
jgi:rhamnose utilization protein RhaD (predicted bifunctional aldolase and dehydrogenase)/NAD(P)-dependent dehydrogenase (short-subunit alcohol dehydrogenase family)